MLKTIQFGTKAFEWVPGSYIFFFELQTNAQFYEVIEKSLSCNLLSSNSLCLPLFKNSFDYII